MLAGTPWTCCWESSDSKDCYHFVFLKKKKKINRRKDVFLQSPSHEDRLEIYRGKNHERCFLMAPAPKAVGSGKLCCSAWACCHSQTATAFFCFFHRATFQCQAHGYSRQDCERHDLAQVWPFHVSQRLLWEKTALQMVPNLEVWLVTRWLCIMLISNFYISI